MIDDFTAAFRSLRSSTTLTIVALVVLSLAIGATTAIFSVVDAVVLKGLPFDEHDRLVAVGERRVPGASTTPKANADPDALMSSAPQNYADWVAEQRVFEEIAAITGGMFSLREPGVAAEALRGQRVTAAFFSVLRTPPRLGRAFTAEHEVEGRHRVAVLSHGLWTRRLGADPGIVGKTLPIEGGPYEVVGVMAPEFESPTGAGHAVDLWVPYFVPSDERLRGSTRTGRYLEIIARLKAGVTIGQAQANLDQISTTLAQAHPEWNRGTRAGVRPLVDHLVGGTTRRWMLLLLGAVAMVLLIACANVANLLLAKARTREREIAIRAAIGAGRWRLLRQLLVESLMLSVVGTLLGLLLAWWAVGVLRNAMPDGVPRVTSIALDLRVLGLAAALALITALLFGIWPAIRLSRPDVAGALTAGVRGAGKDRRRLHGALVIAEVALAVVLLVAAALFVTSFRAVMRVDPGFDSENVLTLSIVPRLELAPSTNRELPDHGPQLQTIVDRLVAMPRIRSASVVVGGVPLAGGAGLAKLNDISVAVRRVTAQYHDTLGIALKAGRFIDATDGAGTTLVVVLNEVTARAAFPELPIHRVVGRDVQLNGVTRVVIGVIADVHQVSLETSPQADVYVPMAQQRTIFSDLVVKTNGAAYDALPDVKAAVFETMPDALLRNVTTLDEVLRQRTASRRFNMLLVGSFGVLGLLIAAVGVYGVMAHGVTQRTREIGVRLALGATRRRVLSMVLGQATVLVGLGLLIGGVAASVLAESAESFLFATSVHDRSAFVAAFGTLTCAGLLATVIPARRAASVDPTVALRAE